MSEVATLFDKIYPRPVAPDFFTLVVMLFTSSRPPFRHAFAILLLHLRQRHRTIALSDVMNIIDAADRLLMSVRERKWRERERVAMRSCREGS
jgi:hypothetical protein